MMTNEEYVQICRRLDDAEKTLSAVAKRLVEYQRVMKMLADELTELHKQHEVYWEEAGESSPALIAYRKLMGE
jgi:phosphoketolase